MPSTAQTTAIQVRVAIFSRRNSQLMTATQAGMEAMITPAEVALVRLTPEIMQMVNRKLPKSDCRNSSPRVCVVIGGSSGVLRSQCGMATTPMPKRSQASRKIGNVAASGFDNAT